ncbi:hypothetical protein VTO73DRAFT_6716 [Trametes versicolor]
MVLVFGVGAALLGISCWSVVGQHEDVELRGGCHLLADRMTAIRLAVSWEALFVFDLMVFSLTLGKTLSERYRTRVTSGRHDIISLILRDGSMYFAVMASVNFANTLTFYFLEPLLRGCLSTFASSVSVTMMSRLMLNLQGSAAGRDVVASSSAYPTTSDNSTSMLFTSRISSMPMGGAGATYTQTQCDFPAERSRLGRDSAYVRGAESHPGYGYIGEMYELRELGMHDGEDGALRIHPDEGLAGA